MSELPEAPVGEAPMSPDASPAAVGILSSLIGVGNWLKALASTPANI